MVLYILYRIGYFLAMYLPLRASYGLACVIGDICYLANPRDRTAIKNNLRTIMAGQTDERVLREKTRELYRNFAKYLVDFFRLSEIDNDYVNKFVHIEGAENVDKVLARGKGVIALSAHMGNWELGGAVFSTIGYPLSAVVLTHGNKKINAFFTRQRLKGRVMPVERGMSLKECYRVLKSNRSLALLGDRDFSKNGLKLNFFGRKTSFPKGPAAFSYRLGSGIVPTFVIRQSDDTFRLIMEEPIYADTAKDEESAVAETAIKCAAIIESYVKKYPTQWYIFKDMWNKDE